MFGIFKKKARKAVVEVKKMENRDAVEAISVLAMKLRRDLLMLRRCANWLTLPVQTMLLMFFACALMSLTTTASGKKKRSSSRKLLRRCNFHWTSTCDREIALGSRRGIDVPGGCHRLHQQNDVHPC